MANIEIQSTVIGSNYDKVIDTEEMIMMGLDLMKSNMPPLYKKFGQKLLTEIMSGKPKAEIDKQIMVHLLVENL